MARRYDNLAYNYHSAAEVPAYSPYENPNIRIKTSTKKKTNTKVKYNYNAIIKLALLALFAFSVLCRGVMITDKANELTHLKKELTDVRAKNQELQMEIDRSLDLTRIEQLASEKLNMRRPEKYQIVYINLDRVDYVEKAEGTKNAAITHASKLFNNIKSYLD